MRHPIVARLQNAKGALVTHVNQDPKAEFEDDGVFERAEVLDVFQDEEPWPELQNRLINIILALLEEVSKRT